MKNLLKSIICCICLLNAACSIHEIDIQQGNVVTPELAAQLKPGMDKQQVTFILGTPLITDTFHHDRWDYIYLFQPHKGNQERYHISLYFKDDKLVRIEHDNPYNEDLSNPP